MQNCKSRSCTERNWSVALSQHTIDSDEHSAAEITVRASRVKKIRFIQWFLGTEEVKKDKRKTMMLQFDLEALNKMEEEDRAQQQLEQEEEQKTQQTASSAPSSPAQQKRSLSPPPQPVSAV